MDNRNRDKMSKDSTGSTSAGNVNRDVSQRESGSSQFGSKIGQSEGLGSSSGRSSGSSDLGSSSSSNKPSSSSENTWQSSTNKRGSGSSSGSEEH